MKVTERFSNRVENYAKYRPSYPAAIIPFLEKEIGLTGHSIIADIGSGTGILTELFLRNGNPVLGIEPNKAMREGGERILGRYSKFKSIDGSAESTTLSDDSIDIIIAAQAFHWFDVVKAKLEFRRILKHGGYVVLIWNNRSLDGTPFLRAFEKLLCTFGTDYPVVQDSEILENIKAIFNEKGYLLHQFPNSQSLDYEGLKGRLLSDSYIPTESAANYQDMLVELRRIFDENQVGGKIEILYTTDIYYGRL